MPFDSSLKKQVSLTTPRLKVARSLRHSVDFWLKNSSGDTQRWNSGESHLTGNLYHSRQNPLDHVSMDVGQATINAVVPDGQSCVVDAEQVQNGGVNVVDLCRTAAVKRFVAPLIRLTAGHASLDAAACKPIRKDIRIVVTALASLGTRHSSKFGGPQDNRLLQQAALLKVFQQRRRPDCHASRQRLMITLDIFMGVPVATRKTVIVAGPDLDESHSSFEQPASNQTLPPKVFRFLSRVDFVRISRPESIESVHLHDVIRFAGNV